MITAKIRKNNFFGVGSAHSEKYILHRHPVPVNKYTGLQKQPYPYFVGCSLVF